jgi:hypothetical protein
MSCDVARADDLVITMKRLRTLASGLIVQQDFGEGAQRVLAQWICAHLDLGSLPLVRGAVGVKTRMSRLRGSKAWTLR